MKIQTINRFIACACVFAGFMGRVDAQSTRPNVLFIAIDDLVTTLGCYGDEVAKTPEIDALASQGTTFLNHHCVWSVCGPSRVALATSLTPEETGVLGFRPMRDPNILPDVITLPQHFKNNGYETACTGKFYDPRTVGTAPLFKNGKKEDDPLSWSIHYVQVKGGYSPPKIIDNGKYFSVAYDDANKQDRYYLDHKILMAGKTLMQNLSGGTKPFFLAVGFKKPHLAFVAPKRMWDKYDRASLPLASFQSMPASATSYTNYVLGDNAEVEGYADPVTKKQYATPLNLTDDQQRALIHGYYACVSWVDYLVGQLIDELAVLNDPVQPGKKMSETTIIVLWGDHGFHLGDHGRWAKHSGMQRGTSCPLIIYDPRNPQNGAKTNSPVSTLDIYPTLCELAGLPIPSQPMDNTSGSTGRPLKGRSVVPILNDPTVSVNHGAINLFKTHGGYGYSYRTERFRYIEWVNGSNVVTGRDLYDYTVDPLETKNLAGDPAYKSIVFQLSRAMRAEGAFRDPNTRLQKSSPIASGGDVEIPFTSMVKGGSPDTFVLRWPDVGGRTIKVISNTDLGSTWTEQASNLTGNHYNYTIPVNENRRFFRVAIGTNSPPLWKSDPFTAVSATAGDPYNANISSMASDPDVGDTLTFSKIDGPAWLTVAADGTLSGTPNQARADYFTVKVTDNHGASTIAKLQITVQ